MMTSMWCGSLTGPYVCIVGELLGDRTACDAQRPATRMRATK
jgi:hypothetical protein